MQIAAKHFSSARRSPTTGRITNAIAELPIFEHYVFDLRRRTAGSCRLVESNPPRRLVFTWARPTDAKDDSKHSRVAIDIEPHGDGLVRLTVTHEDLERDPQMLAGISGGWPKVLSNLKTLLETGRALPRSPSVT